MIVEYIKSLLGMVKKDEVLEDLRITMKDIEYYKKIFSGTSAELAVHGKGGIVNIPIVLSKLSSKEAKSVASDFYRHYKPTGVKKQSKLFPDIGNALAVVYQNVLYIESQLENLLEQAVIKEGITAKKATLIRACDHISFIVKYSTDLCEYLLDCETLESLKGKNGSNRDTLGSIRPNDIDDLETISKLLAKKIGDNIINYAKLLTIYTMSPDDFKQQLDDIPDVILNDKTSGSVVSVYGNKIDPFGTTLTKEFKGSPIYHYRLIVAEWQANRYRLMKEKKKMLELKVMQLQLLNEKNPDPKLDKEIEYMQNRIGKLEYSLHQMET